MPKISFKGLSLIIAGALGTWSYVFDQFWPVSIVFWTYVAVFIICWLRAFAKTCGEVEELKAKLTDKENKQRFVADIRPVMNQETLHNPLNKGAPLYDEALVVLQNNSAVSKVWIDIFKNDTSLRQKFDSMHRPGELRIRLLNELIYSLL